MRSLAGAEGVQREQTFTFPERDKKAELGSWGWPDTESEVLFSLTMEIMANAEGEEGGKLGRWGRRSSPICTCFFFFLRTEPANGAVL